jgi:hypothetical protein
MRRQLAEVQASFPPLDPSSYPIATPWGSSDLSRWVWSDILGADVPSNSRAAAMRLPALARGRNLIVSSIAGQPMRLLTGETVEAEQPSWLTQTGDGSSPQIRNGWTVDDLIFYGWSCWSRHFDGDEWVAASRINYGDWVINADMQVEVNGVPVDPESVVVIPGLHEGILTFGAETIDDVRTLYRNVRARLLNPVPGIDLHQTGGDQLTDPEIDALIARWAAARQGTNAGVSYTNEVIEAKPLTGGDEQLMIEARNAAAVDLARLIGVHAGIVDATAPKASLNYETTTGRNQEFVDFDLALYMTPITARLSLDDCTEPGQRVDFDLSNLTAPAPSPTGPNLED